MHRRRHTRSRRAALLAVAFAGFCTLASQPAVHGASSSSVVGASVAASTSIDTTSCRTKTAATDLGLVVQGTTGVTSLPCTVGFGASNDAARLTISQADGRGKALERPPSDTLDPAFAGTGDLAIDLGSSRRFDSYGATRQADGKYVLVGSVTGSESDTSSGISTAAAVRFNADGSVDASFGTSGKVTVPIDARSRFFDVAQQSDGKLVIVGASMGSGGTSDDTSRAQVVRLATNGALDTTFNGTGIRRVNPSGTRSEAFFGVTIEPSGRILAVGGTSVTFFGEYRGLNSLIAAVTSAGALSTDWNGTGMIEANYYSVSASYQEYFTSVHSLASGKVLVSGRGDTGGTDVEQVVMRYNADGSRDATYGPGAPWSGMLTVARVGNTINWDMHVEADGSAWLAGSTTVGCCTSSYEVARITAAGQVDTAYAASGFALGAQRMMPTSISLDSSGRVLLGGLWYAPGSGAWSISYGALNTTLVARLATDGTLDPTFATAGMATMPGTRGGTGAAELMIDSPTSMTVAMTDGHLASAARIDANGLLDGTWGSDGLAIGPSFGTGLGGGNLGRGDMLRAAVSRPDGSIIAVGNRVVRTREAVVLARTAAGAADTSFSGDGLLELDFGGTPMTASDAIHDPVRGRTLILLSALNLSAAGAPNERNDYVVAVRDDGSLDPTFATAGMFEISNPAISFRASALDVQSTGRVVIAGSNSLNGGNMAAARIHPWGSIDTTFGTAGWATIDGSTLATNEYSSGIDIDADDKIVLFGSENWNYHAVARLLPDGTPDTTFSGDGYLSCCADYSTEGTALPDGSIIFGGGNDSSFGTNVPLVKVLNDGSLDPSFGVNGRVQELVPYGYSDADSVIALEDGSAYFVGYVSDSHPVGLHKLRPNGTLDTGFGVDGIMQFPAGTMSWGAQIDLGVDGRLILSGRGTDNKDARLMVLAGSTVDDYAIGSLDWSGAGAAFGTCLESVGGIATTTWMTGACALADDGRWRGVPDTALAPGATIAQTPGSGTGSVSIRFAFKTTLTQDAGLYRAPIRFDVIAPAV